MIRYTLMFFVLVMNAHAEEIIMSLTVNGVERPAVLVDRDERGMLSVSADDYRSWGLTPPAGVERVVLDSAEANFDENAVKLVVTVDPARLPAQRIAATWHPPVADDRIEPSAFLNWSLLTQTGRGPSTTLEHGIRWGHTLLYGSGIYDAGSYRRLTWAAIRDDRERMRRVTLGDHFTAPGSLHSPFAMTGLSIATERSLNPYRTFWPTLSLTTAAALPSEVEVRVDGQTIRRERIAPGPVNVEEITGAMGSRNVEVVIRDAFGREQVVAQDFTFTDLALAAGTHEYGYHVGALRNGYGTADDRLGALAFSASHRYGLSDHATLGFAAQASAGMLNIGPSATFITRAGVVNIASSHTGNAHALGAAWAYRKGRFGVAVNARHNTAGYTALPSRLAQPARTSFATSASVGVGPGNVAVGFSKSEGLRIISAGYAANIARNALLIISAAKINDETVLTAAVRVSFDATHSANVTAGTNGNAIEVTRQVPRAEGWGGGMRLGDVPEAFVQLNAQYGLLRARANSEQSLLLAGGIGHVAGRTFFSRPLSDAFGVVKVGDLEGVEVHAGSARAVTDKRGEAVVPLMAHGHNVVRFDQRAVPMDFAFGEPSMNVSPAFRSGVKIAFDVRERRSVMGRLVGVENREITLRRGEHVLRTFTTGGGEFSVEDIKPGEWTVEANGCAATLQVPDEPLAEVGEILCSP